MKMFTVTFLAIFSLGCYAEFDAPKIPRRDCLGNIQDSYVYVMPECRKLPVKHPKDNELKVTNA